MSNTYKPHLDQQPKNNDDRKKQQTLDTDREKPSSEPIDFEEHDDRLGGDPDTPREERKDSGQRQSQSQKQSQG